MLAHHLTQPFSACHMLELYAGSGIMALEAISRGMNSVTSLEASPRACRAMRQQAGRLAIAPQRWHICQGRIPHALSAVTGQYYAVIFADPPYHQGDSAALPAWLMRHAIDFDILVVEEASDAMPDYAGLALETLAIRRYGHSSLTLLKKIPLEKA